MSDKQAAKEGAPRRRGDPSGGRATDVRRERVWMDHVDGELFAEIEHPGQNQEHEVTCSFESGDFFPGELTIIEFSGFVLP